MRRWDSRRLGVAVHLEGGGTTGLFPGPWAQMIRPRLGVKISLGGDAGVVGKGAGGKYIRK